ncbi:hypothetical protein ACLB2K_020530 [Fragaria x ananassa]
MRVQSNRTRGSTCTAKRRSTLGCKDENACTVCPCVQPRGTQRWVVRMRTHVQGLTRAFGIGSHNKSLKSPSKKNDLVGEFKCKDACRSAHTLKHLRLWVRVRKQHSFVLANGSLSRPLEESSNSLIKKLLLLGLEFVRSNERETCADTRWVIGSDFN